jgi:uncharacterized protein YecT (DUF1311 family)
MKSAYVAAVVILGAVSFDAVAQRSASSELLCSKAEGHASQRECLEKRAERSSAQLEIAEQKIRQRFERWDANSEYRQRASQLFDEAEKQFGHSREAQCEFESSLSAGGNSASDRRLMCQIEMNERRIVDLGRIGSDELLP